MSSRELQSSKTLASELVTRLAEEIRDGTLQPGEKLRQQDVARRFDVSTTPVREAFASLERDGLLISHPHRGVIVFRPTLDDLVHTYEIRVKLESLAVEKAVPNLTQEDFEALKDLLEQMSALKKGNDPRYPDLNDRFHSRIYAAARRPKLERIISECRAASTSYIRLFGVASPFSASMTQADHTAIYEACVAGDADEAAARMAAHLQHTVDYVAPMLEDRVLDGDGDGDG